MPAANNFRQSKTSPNIRIIQSYAVFEEVIRMVFSSYSVFLRPLSLICS